MKPLGTMLWLLAGILMPVIAEAAPELPMARAVQSTLSSFTFRVDVPEPEIVDFGNGDVIVSVDGYGPFAQVGAPDLPQRTFLIGIPEGVEPTLQVRVLGSRRLPGARPRPVPLAKIEAVNDGLPTQTNDYARDPSLYADEFPQVWARLGDKGRLRHLSVVRVEVFPFRWDPAMPGIEMATAMEIEVSWPANASRPAGRQSVSQDRESWDRTYSRSVLNWDVARSFRTSPSGWERSGLGRQWGSSPQMRIDVDSTAIYRVTYENLAAAGWDAGPVPIEQLAMEERRFDETDPENPFKSVDVPIHVIDNDENGQFSAQDEVYFFGRTSWDSFQPHPRIKRYGRRNAYWFFARPEGGARMERIPSSLGRTDLSSETQFVWTERIEKDGVYMDLVTHEDTIVLRDGILNVGSEHFYWMGPLEGTFHATIELPGVIRGRRLRGQYQGMMQGTGVPQFSVPRLSFGPEGGSLVAVPDVPVGNRLRVPFDFSGPAVEAIPLANRTQLEMSLALETFGAALDYVEWTYDRSYETFEDRIAFQTGSLTGPRQFDLSGFSSFDILLFDVTDSLAPRFVTFEPGQTFREGGDRVLRVQFDLGSTPPRRVFTAMEWEAALSPVEVERASDRDLTAPGEAELIVITHPDFLQGIQPLVAQRRSQGWDVEVATVREVFDQFDGGRATPTAIRNYLRYLFRSRSVDPTHLLLVGDASNDFANVTSRSDPNFVPTQTMPGDAFASVRELVACDVWYVDNLAGTGEQLDFLYDMHVGRLPVGDQTELNNVVSKIVGYANFRDADQWRNRGITMADDEFSSRISFDDDYEYRPTEQVFRNGAEDADEVIRESGFTDFSPESFFLECYLDTVPCLGRCVPTNPQEPDCADRICQVAADGCGAATQIGQGIPLDFFYTQQVVTEQLQLPRLFQNMVSRGYLYVAFQAHGNRAQATHELLWLEQEGGRSDSAQLQNVEKPFLFLGFGCHFAYFSHHEEARYGRDDSMAEKMLFLDRGRGSVASFASTAYEWLEANGLLQVAMMRSWFLDPNLDGEGHARWLLGDLIDGGKAELLRTSSAYGAAQTLTYTLLGDPSMTIDLAPPRLDRVEVNGAPWTEGESLIAEGESDSVRIAVWLRDEAWIQTVSVLEGGVEIDPSRYTVVPDSAYAADGRRAILLYETALDVPGTDYQIEVRGRDRAGRARSVYFPVSLSARFELQHPDGWVELKNGDIISVGDSVRVTLNLPIRREPGDLELLLDGKPLPVERIPLPGSEHGWRLEGVIPFVKEQGAQPLEVSVARREGGDAVRSVSLVGSAGSGDVALSDVFNFPNPFTTDTRFLYRLNGAARSARVQVFTLRGQKIFEAGGTARPGENAIAWDGRDMDGDEVANGVYFYKLEVETDGGRKLSRIERIARVR